MKKWIALCLLLCAAATIFLLSGCKPGTPPSAEMEPDLWAEPVRRGDDGPYTVWSGKYACLSNATCFAVDGLLYGIGDTQKITRITDLKNDTGAESAERLPSSSIYAAGERIAYLTEEGDALVLSMVDPVTGTLTRSGQVMTFTNKNREYSWRIAGDWILIQTDAGPDADGNSRLYLYGLEDRAAKGEILKAYSDLAPLTVVNLTPEWLAAAYVGEDRLTHVIAYHLTAGDVFELYATDNFPMTLGAFTEAGYCWNTMDQGFFRRELSPEGETVTLAQPAVRGVACYDRQFTYLFDVESGESNQPRTLYIYDHEGSQKAVLAPDGLTGVPSYAFSTDRYVYFYDFSEKPLSGRPVFYLEKEKIGTAELCWKLVG